MSVVSLNPLNEDIPEITYPEYVLFNFTCIELSTGKRKIIFEILLKIILKLYLRAILY